MLHKEAVIASCAMGCAEHVIDDEKMRIGDEEEDKITYNYNSIVSIVSIVSILK